METRVTEIRKRDIQNALADYCARYGGQSKASKILDGVSSGTISQMVNGNWENISDEMWRKVASQIGLEADKWNAVETQNYARLMQVLSDAQENTLWMAITGSAAVTIKTCSMCLVTRTGTNVSSSPFFCAR